MVVFTEYFLLELSFYVSLSMTLFIDVKRKDFLQNVIHHAVTILLMGMYSLCNINKTVWMWYIEIFTLCIFKWLKSAIPFWAPLNPPYLVST